MFSLSLSHLFVFCLVPLICHPSLQEELKTRHFLWQAYHIEQDMTDARKDAATHKESLEVAEATHQAHEAEVEAKRKEHAGVAKERLLLEKQIKKKKAELEKKVGEIDQKKKFSTIYLHFIHIDTTIYTYIYVCVFIVLFQNPGLIKTREQISHANRRMKATEKDLENAKRKAKDHAAKIASLKDQLVNLEDGKLTFLEESYYQYSSVLICLNFNCSGVPYRLIENSLCPNTVLQFNNLWRKRSLPPKLNALSSPPTSFKSTTALRSSWAPKQPNLKPTEWPCKPLKTPTMNPPVCKRMPLPPSAPALKTLKRAWQRIKRGWRL